MIRQRQAHPDYLPHYRAKHPEAVERNRERQQRRDQKRRIRWLEKNNLALDLKRSAAEVWMVGPRVADLEKNNLASTQVFIQDAQTTAEAERLESLCDHRGTRMRILLEELTDDGLEGIQLAGALPRSGGLHRCGDVFGDRSATDAQMTSDLAHRPVPNRRLRRMLEKNAAWLTLKPANVDPF